MDAQEIIEINSSSGSVYNYPSVINLVSDSANSTTSINAPPRSQRSRSSQAEKGSVVRDNFTTPYLSDNDSEGSHVGNSAESRISTATSRKRVLSQEECNTDVFKYHDHLKSAEEFVFVTLVFVHERYRRLYSSYSDEQRLAWIRSKLAKFKAYLGKDSPIIRPEDEPEWNDEDDGQ